MSRQKEREVGGKKEGKNRNNVRSNPKKSANTGS